MNGLPCSVESFLFKQKVVMCGLPIYLLGTFMKPPTPNYDKFVGGFASIPPPATANHCFNVCSPFLHMAITPLWQRWHWRLLMFIQLCYLVENVEVEHRWRPGDAPMKQEIHYPTLGSLKRKIWHSQSASTNT